MIYHSVAEIFDEMDNSHRRLVERVEGLNETQENFRPSPDAWSIAEIVEHLSITEGRMFNLLNKMLAETETAGDGAGIKDSHFHPFSLDHLIERSRNEKIETPVAARPRGGVPLSDSLLKMRRTREELRALLPRLEAADLSSAAYPHPIFGPLDVYQWLAFVGLHEDRHLGQIGSLIERPEFQASR